MALQGYGNSKFEVDSEDGMNVVEEFYQGEDGLSTLEENAFNIQQGLQDECIYMSYFLYK